MPKKSGGNVISQSPSRKSRSRIAATTNPSGWRSAGDGSRRSAATRSTTSRAATAANVPRTPTTLAAAPTTGPSSAPKTAAPIAVPIVWPRRSRGVASASQASPPAQVSDEPKPWANRAATSGQ